MIPRLDERRNHYLKELVSRKSIMWETWFGVAASVLLGCPFKSTVTNLANPGMTTCAIQYGNLATTAIWLDLTQKLRARGSFGLSYGEGKLSPFADTSEGQECRGIEETFAIVQTESTEITESYQ